VVSKILSIQGREATCGKIKMITQNKLVGKCHKKAKQVLLLHGKYSVSIQNHKSVQCMCIVIKFAFFGMANSAFSMLVGAHGL